MIAVWVLLGLIIGVITVAARYAATSTHRKPTAATRASQARSAGTREMFRQIAEGKEKD